MRRPNKCEREIIALQPAIEEIIGRYPKYSVMVVVDQLARMSARVLMGRMGMRGNQYAFPGNEGFKTAQDYLKVAFELEMKKIAKTELRKAKRSGKR